ncbi:MAG: ThiF family adenylyltransferase [DPANN group archaeon]|nr:ThiF family adenylyltransferase [DPANN group archaeon]
MCPSCTAEFEPAESQQPQQEDNQNVSQNQIQECPDCGENVDDEDNVCPHCGAEFEDNDDDEEDENGEVIFEEVREEQSSRQSAPSAQQQGHLSNRGDITFGDLTRERPLTRYASAIMSGLQNLPSYSLPLQHTQSAPRPAQAQASPPQPASTGDLTTEIVAERYDRQARIAGWNQKKIEEMVLTIIGYNTFSEYLALSASALGVRKICIIATPQDLPGQQAPMLRLSNKQERRGRLEEMIKKVGNADLEYLVASMASKPEKYFLAGSDVVVDTTGRHESRALALDAGNEGKKNHTELVHFYEGGFLMLSHRDNPNPLYGKLAVQPDIINAMLAAGVALSEIAKSFVFQKCEKKETVVYELPNAKKSDEDYAPYKVLLIGAGALGNFVGQGLAALGFNLVDILDFDTIETTNLNRQLLFYESVGQQKAKVLADRCAAIRGKDARYEGINEKFGEGFGIKEYDLVIDCVDNFATRALISKKCVESKIPLVSAGTSHNSGQATVYIPGKTRCADHALGYGSQAEQEAEQQARMVREGGCLMQPNPSVIMSNQVMAAMMINMARHVFHPSRFGEPASGYMMYRADSPNRFGWVGLERCGD